MITNVILFMALLVYGAAIYTVENKPSRSVQNVCAGNRFQNIETFQIGFRKSEDPEKRLGSGNVTNQKLWNVPQISNSVILR